MTEKKVPLELLFDFHKALAEVAKVAEMGAKKHGLRTWMNDFDLENNEGAMLRHKFKRFSGIPVDEESGLSHRAHEAWRALAGLELELRQAKPAPKQVVNSRFTLEPAEGLSADSACLGRQL